MLMSWFGDLIAKIKKPKKPKKGSDGE